MGLAERRIAVAYEKEQFPAWKKKLEEIVGYPLGWEVSFEPLVKEGFLESYPATLDHNFFQPLEQALRSICADDLGKNALAARIKRVRITSNRSWSSLEVTIDGDALVLDADPSYYRTDDCVADYATLIRVTLEKAL